MQGAKDAIADATVNRIANYLSGETEESEGGKKGGKKINDWLKKFIFRF